jgi:quinol-cytochrome oxidoreductase complex cytochrome b subunit
VFLTLILGLTGILELFYYIPDPEQAALSVQTITYLVPFGGFIRNLHYWSAQFLIIVSAVHLLRVVFTAAYRAPRRFNYLLGLALFVLTILLDFTGYILRWDVDICYPLLTGTNLLKTIPGIGNFLYDLAVGGGEACSTGLLRFYIWHIFGLTTVAVLLTVWHAFRVRRDGGIAVPSPRLRTDSTRISRNELVRREVLAALVVGIVLILVSSLAPAPIAAAMTEAAATGEAGAPWFFLWIQQMLTWGDPLLFGILVPVLVLIILGLIPYIFPQPAEADVGRWFPRSNRLAQITITGIAVFIIILTLIAKAN